MTRYYAEPTPPDDMTIWDREDSDSGWGPPGYVATVTLALRLPARRVLALRIVRLLNWDAVYGGRAADIKGGRAADIRRRRAQGETLREIGSALGISAQRVHEILASPQAQ